MTLKINKAFALAAMLASVAFGEAMAQDTRDVVVNSFGNKVVNTYGNCVRVKWGADLDKCGTEAPAAKVSGEKSRSYLVFFDFDKSNLTEDAKDILNTVFADAKQKKASTFEITGHADRSGSDDYNVALSSRRAETVKRQLMAMGADERMHTEAKGESVPLVPTADGVREPQNRRVEIIFGYRD